MSYKRSIEERSVKQRAIQESRCLLCEPDLALPNMIHIFQQLELIRTERELHLLLQKMAVLLGGQQLAFFIFEPDDDGLLELAYQNISTENQHGNKTYFWHDSYLKRKLYRLDPAIQCLHYQAQSFNRTQLYASSRLDKSSEFIMLSKATGIQGGACAGSIIDSYKGCIGLLSIVGVTLGPECLSVLQLWYSSLCRLMPAIVIYNKLTKREKEVLKWLNEALPIQEIARVCTISERTVKFHLKNIYQKLNVENRAEAMVIVPKHILAS